MKSEKSVGTAFVLWFFLGGFGAHRIYVKEQPLTFLWYWLAALCTFSIILWVDLFLISGWVKKNNVEAFAQRKELF